jgi:deoxyribodipyrimidine photo-lyase
VLLVTPEDLDPEPGLLDENQRLAVVVADDPGLSSGDLAFRFTQGAARDAVERLASRLEGPVGLLPDLSAESLAAAARSAGVKRIVTPYAPVGPTATALARLAPALAQEGLEIVQVRRAWDDRLWPHARAGFFAFRKAIPALPGVEAGG